MMPVATKSGPRKTVNKSNEIRKLLRKDPEMLPKAVIRRLELKGVTVTNALVSQIKYKEFGPACDGNGDTAVVDPPPKRKYNKRKNPSFDILLAAAKFRDEAGGIKQAKQAVDILEQLS